MMQKTTQNQFIADEKQYRAEKLARFGEFKDPEADMRAEVGDLLMLFTSDADDQEITTGLLVFLHRLACQDHLMAADCLSWAATHCYQWTKDCEQAQEAYVASILQQRAERKAAKAVGAKIKGGAK